MTDQRETSGELPSEMTVQWKGSTAEIHNLDAMFSGERNVLYDRADFKGSVGRVSIISGESPDGHMPTLAAAIQFEPYESQAPRDSISLITGSYHTSSDPIKKFLGQDSLLASSITGPESAFGPTGLVHSELEDDGLVISKTAFSNIFKVVAGPGNTVMVWVDKEKRRVVVTNNREWTGTSAGKETSVGVVPPLEGTVDETMVAEGFLKTVMRTVDFCVGLDDKQYGAMYHREERTYKIGKEIGQRHNLQPEAETTVQGLGGAATQQSLEQQQPSETPEPAQQPAPTQDERPNRAAPQRSDIERILKERYSTDLPEIKKPEGLTLDDIGGLAEVKRVLKDVAISFQHAEIMAKWGAERPQGVLMYGPPGTGKTMLARALAAEIDADMMMVQGSDIYGKWMGESENRIKEIFKAARSHEGRMILFFDEMESFVGISDSASGNGDSTRNAVAGIFKQELNTLAEENPNVLVVGVTNFLESIDPSLIRSGRFDIRVRVPMPDQEARTQILDSIMNRHTKKTGQQMFDSQIDTNTLAELADGLSGADMTEVFRRLIMDKAMAEARSGNTSGNPSVSHQEIVQAIENFATSQED